MAKQPTPLFDEPQDKPTKYDGLLGWSAEWKCNLDQQDKPVPLDDMTSLSPEGLHVIVRKGDTLGRIAADYHCSVEELASYNKIESPGLIYPGQVIKVPPGYYEYGNADMGVINTECVLSICFEDLIEKPLSGLNVKIISTLGDVYEFITDGVGKVNDLIIKAGAGVKILVSSRLGKVKEVANFISPEGKASVIISSPKVRIKGLSNTLFGPVGDVENQSAELNTISVGRDAEGKPRIHINHICPNSYDLMLGKNVTYWNHIIQASERSGIIPQSIAAVINAESAKYPGGVWKPTSVCKDSANSTEERVVYKSSAAGMTQFLNGTWMTETLKEGTCLFEKATEQGLVADMPLLDKKGEQVKNKAGEVILVKKFQVSKDSWKSLKELQRENYITGVTPYPRHATPDVQSWLDLRFNPEYAIMAAVDYGVANLLSLKNSGYNIDGINDAEKAKIIYLTHHLGLKNAKRFINNEIEEDIAWALLKAQIGRKSAKTRVEKHGNCVLAHREWLNDYINRNILLSNFFCDELISVNYVRDTDLMPSIDKLRNK